jgi:hypothetical protein
MSRNTIIVLVIKSRGLIKQHTMGTWGKGGVAPHILNLDGGEW